MNLKAESAKLEAQMSVQPAAAPGSQSAYREWDLRAFRLTGPPFAGTTVANLERSFAPDRVFVERIRRGGEILDPAPAMALQVDDVLVVAARRSVLLTSGTPIGEEVEDRQLLDFPIVVRDVVVTKRAAAERTLPDLAAEHGRGVALLKLVRGGEEIPLTASTIVNRGDLLRLMDTAVFIPKNNKWLYRCQMK